MNVAEMVARHALDERRPSVAIVLRPSADALATSLSGGPLVRSWDEHTLGEPGTCTVVEVIQPGREEEQIAELSAVLTTADVALLLFTPPPELLPLGIVTDALTRHRLTVLDACGTTQRTGRTVVAVSRDAERHQRAYLTGTPIPDDEPSRLRRANEWLLEGLQLRSGVLLLERRLEGQSAELSQGRQERRRLDQELTEANERSALLSRQRTAVQNALAARGPSLAMRVRRSKLLKAVRLLVGDPKDGSLRIVRAIARRWHR